MKTIGLAELHDGLYFLKIPQQKACLNIIESGIPENGNCSEDVWHHRLGHPSDKVLQYISDTHPYVCFKQNTVCDTCHYAKQHKLPFLHSNNRSNNIFDMIHVDIWGPFASPSIHGHRFFLTVVDDHSRYTWIFLMRHKSETRTTLSNFINLINNQFGIKIKVIRSDNGNEFAYHDLYNSFGIIHQTSCIETPQQNYVVERKHQHIFNVTRSLIFQSKIPEIYWSFAVIHVVHLINRIPSIVLGKKSLYELVYKELPDLQNLKVFGSLCFACTIERNRSKRDLRLKKCVFLGYKSGTKGYIVLDINSREILVTRNIKFYEHVFPCIKNHDHDIEKNSTEDDFNFLFEPTSNTITEQHCDIVDTNQNFQNIRRSSRNRKAPSFLKDYHHQIMNYAGKNVIDSENIVYPISSVIDYEKLSANHLHFSLAISSITKPQTYNEAAKKPEWREAMKKK